MCPRGLHLWYLTDKYFDIVWGCHPPRDPPKNLFFERLNLRVPVFYDISRHLTDKYFDIVWECHTPGDPPKIKFLNGSA